MAEAQNNPPSELDTKLALLDGKLEALSDLAQAVAGMRQMVGETTQMVGEATRQVIENSSAIRERILWLEQKQAADEATKQMIDATIQQVTENSRMLRERLLPLVEQVTAEQTQLRALILRKTESLQDTMDLVRQDTRNAWNTADFAIPHGVGSNHQTREEIEKLLAMISGMQRQQQILTSQVEELRRGAAEREGGGAPRTG